MTIEQAREAVKVERVMVRDLTKLVKAITKKLDLDAERMDKRLAAARKSEYGPVHGLINLLVAIANWPAEKGDGALVTTNQSIIESEFGIDLLLCDRIKAAKGFHSFCSEDLEIINGEAPDMEAYNMYSLVLLEDLEIDYPTDLKSRLTLDKWTAVEKRKAEQAKADKKELEEELAEFIASK